MRFLVGTSGYSYPKWKGRFYPERFPAKEMLGFYSRRFATVELNNSFYRMPSVQDMKSWAEQTPATFLFALKAPQTITHRKRLKNVTREVGQLLRTVAILKRRLGPLLFQLPPNFKKDIPRLEGLLGLIAKGTSMALEFRHPSWFDDEVFAALRERSCALCHADTDELPCGDLVRTARWGYVRLRRENYTDDELVEWIKKLRSQNWQKVYVYFKHEDTGSGPRLAARFLELAAE